MDYNPLSQFHQQLVAFFIKPNEEAAGDVVPSLKKCGEIVRYHRERLSQTGDISLAATPLYWQKFAAEQQGKLRRNADTLLADQEHCRELIAASQHWHLPLCEVGPIDKGRYVLHFDRRTVIRYVLNDILAKGFGYGRPQKTEQSPTIGLQVKPFAGATDCALPMRQYRLQQLHNIVRRLIEYSSYQYVEARKEDTLWMAIEPEKCSKQRQEEHVCLVSGPVLEPVKKTATKLTIGEYLGLRSTHMRLSAMHRDGYRPDDMGKMDALMYRLGHAAVIVDLFEVRHGTAATVVRNGQGSTKGASHILYNSARVETLLRNFATLVQDKTYDPLPPLEAIDCSFLDGDIDWELIYVHLLKFPEVLETVMAQVRKGLCGVHLLVHFTDNLASAFSRYYHDKKVLLQNRPHLMPIVYARVYLVMAMRQVLNLALSLLGIEPVDYI
ncbi:DALR anticodon-binding domain-containing protein 3 [Drosophila ficusphila]|uniref:DALR anticodon-binding domain-containing protein 3 n=1 Tax=Drosophila ficusphila TaxID=30025 RepID=UPI0007E85162|nr:DALR anticodon-binding domain-containing protein 3 [Drosophila ficusphila]